MHRSLMAAAAAVVVSLLPAQFAAAEGDPPLDPFAVTPLMSGAKAPSFTALDANNEAFEFDPTAREKPAILIFYRGGWCPYCNIHWQELRKIEDKLLATGAELFFLSPDKPARLAEAVQEEQNYQVLSDASMAVSKAFGIAFKLDDATIEKYKGYGIDLEEASGYDHHLLPAPAVFIVDTDGIIKFQYVNPDYKVRISPEVLLAAAQTMPSYQLPRD